mmetsp:Transcript_5330/g.13497  ORF Transcript_5330/g.13497 Transcript_5330/m.13497 type:complete len:219 (+) Transcript_5330:1-657(+)
MGRHSTPAPSPARLYSGPGPGPGVAGSAVGSAPFTPVRVAVVGSLGGLNLGQSASAGLLGLVHQQPATASSPGMLGQSQSATVLRQHRTLGSSSSAGSLRTMQHDVSMSSLMSAGSDSTPVALGPPKSAQLVQQVAAGAAPPGAVVQQLRAPGQQEVWVIEQVVDFTDFAPQGDESCREDSGDIETRIWHTFCSLSPSYLFAGCGRGICAPERRFETA